MCKRMCKRIVAVVVLAATALVLLPGCGSRPSRPGRGTVWGKVLLEGEPLQGGVIHFVQGDKKVAALWISAAGIYSGEIPTGPTKVAIETDSVKYRDRAAMLEKWKEKNPDLIEKKKKELNLPLPKFIYREIPEHYTDPDKSGLSVDIVAGEQRHDFKLQQQQD